VFAEPTVNDFLARIDWHISKSLDRAGRAVARVRADAAKNGAFQSGRRVILSIDAVRAEFEAGIEATLGELKRTVRNTELDPKLLRDRVGQRLTKFTDDVKGTAQVRDMGITGVDNHVTDEFAAFDKYLQFALRQFDVGFHDAPEPEVPPMTDNSVTVGNMMGNIQQGSPGATQTFEFKLNIEAAQTALQSFESELSKIAIDDDRAMQELAADVATIKAQLSKPSPSVAILHEAGKSVRNVVEGIVAGVLTSPLLMAAAALGKAIGLN
jgi:hypothetical protein